MVPSVEEISDTKHQSISLEQSNEGNLDFTDKIHDYFAIAPECSKISCSEYRKIELEVKGFSYDIIWLEGTHSDISLALMYSLSLVLQSISDICIEISREGLLS